MTHFGDVGHQIVEFQLRMPLYVAEYCSFSTGLPRQLEMSINQFRTWKDIVPQHENSFALSAPDGGISCARRAAMLVFKNDNRQAVRFLLQLSNCIVGRSVVAEDQLVFVLRLLAGDVLFCVRIASFPVTGALPNNR